MADNEIVRETFHELYKENQLFYTGTYVECLAILTESMDDDIAQIFKVTIKEEELMKITVGKPKRWDKSQVLELFDNSPDLTLGELSYRSKWTVREILNVLTEDLDGGDNWTEEEVESAEEYVAFRVEYSKEYAEVEMLDKHGSGNYADDTALEEADLWHQ